MDVRGIHIIRLVLNKFSFPFNHFMIRDKAHIILGNKKEVAVQDAEICFKVDMLVGNSKSSEENQDIW